MVEGLFPVTLECSYVKLNPASMHNHKYLEITIQLFEVLYPGKETDACMQLYNLL